MLLIVKGEILMLDQDETISLLNSGQYRDPNFFRSLLTGLSIACPLEKKPHDCLLREKRALSFDAKVEWVESLSDKMVMDLYSSHHMCFHSKKP